MELAAPTSAVVSASAASAGCCDAPSEFAMEIVAGCTTPSRYIHSSSQPFCVASTRRTDENR
jgi:hypothetical protein